MTYDEKLEVKPHIHRKNGVWCVAYKPITPWRLVVAAITFTDKRTTHLVSY